MGNVAKLPRKLRKFRYVFAVTVLVLSLGAAVALLAGGRSPLWSALPVLALVLLHRLMYRPGSVPIFTYHSVSDAPDWLPWAPNISMPSALFARHLRIIRKAGCRVIATTDLVQARLAGRSVPPRSVVLHLDDGYLDNWVAAFPLLRRYGMPATVFVSTDFIDRTRGLRPTLEDVQAGRARADDLQWPGYLNVDELRAMEGSGLVEIQAHGTDHARVFTGPGVIGRLTAGNWRNLAWVQWGAVAGDKSRWHESDTPPAVPLGADVCENGPALTSRAWLGGRNETQEEYASRALATLRRARLFLGRLLHKDVTVFCWPQNKTSLQARQLAHEAGYAATTAGWEENRQGEDPRVLSRTHVGKDVLGLRCPRADALYFAAQLQVGLGNYYWYFVVIIFNTIRRLVSRCRPQILKSQP